MSVVINTNTAATIASNNLSASTALLQRSLNRLSSGSKIVNASDDAGGVAVAARLGAAAKRSGVATSNIGNAISFLQTQDASLKTMGKILERMSELQSLYTDTTKSSTDLDNYTVEFTKLQTQFGDIVNNSKLNGISTLGTNAALSINTDDQGGSYQLFNPYSDADIDSIAGAAITQAYTSGTSYSAAGTTYTGTLTAAGSITFSIGTGTSGTHSLAVDLASGASLSENVAAINAKTSISGVYATLNSAGTAITLKSASPGVIFGYKVDSAASTGAKLGLTATNFTAATGGSSTEGVVGDMIKNVALGRAKNGADQSALGYYSELATSTKTNYESAISKIMDVDVASESTQLARYNTLVQAGTAMIAQANGSTQSALSLLK